MKFKVWLFDLKKFLNDGDWYINPHGKLYHEDPMTGELMKAPDHSYKILRFTELYDIYGEELYEGDKVALYYYHQNIITNYSEISYKSGKWLLDDCISLSDQYLDNKKKYGDVCKVVKIKSKYE